MLKESDDDGYEPLSFVLPKKRKSRAKKRPARKWYNEKNRATTPATVPTIVL